jgi:hypothetical protein
VKPSISIDERGILLHVTDSEGKGVAIPLDSRSIVELTAGLARARAKLVRPEGRKVLMRELGRIVWELMTDPKEKANGD